MVRVMGNDVSDVFESPTNGRDSTDSITVSESMEERPEAMVLPFGQHKKFIPTKHNAIGPHVFFAICRIFGCYHFDDKGKCTIQNLAYSSIFNFLLVSSYAYTFEERIKHGVDGLENRGLSVSIGLVINGGNVIFVVFNGVVLYLYKSRFPQVMKNVREFDFHAGNKVALALLLSIYAAMVVPYTNAERWFRCPFDLVVFQHFLYVSQYVVLSNRWNRYLTTMTKFVARFDEKMMEGHAKIIRSHRSLNDVYGLPILFNVVLSFTITVENLFGFYNSLKTGKISYRYIPPVLFHSVLIFWVAAASDFTTKLADTFNTELFKVMIRNGKLRSNTSLRLYLLKKYTLDFTACGFFTVGYPFITSLIAAAVTYLVVLIQFTE